MNQRSSYVPSMTCSYVQPRYQSGQKPSANIAHRKSHSMDSQVMAAAAARNNSVANIEDSSLPGTFCILSANKKEKNFTKFNICTLFEK